MKGFGHLFLRITTVSLLVNCFCLRSIDCAFWRKQRIGTQRRDKRVAVTVPSHSNVYTAFVLPLRPSCLLMLMWFVRVFVLQGYIKGYISHQHQKLVVSKQNPFPALTSFLQVARTYVRPASSKLDIQHAFNRLDISLLLNHPAEQDYAGTHLLKYIKALNVFQLSVIHGNFQNKRFRRRACLTCHHC